MNQKFLVLKATEGTGGTVEYSAVGTITCERSESRQCAADVIGDIGDGTYYVVPLGDRIVAETRRVITGVKAQRTKAATTDKATKKQRKKRGLAESAKLTRDSAATTP